MHNAQTIRTYLSRHIWSDVQKMEQPIPLHPDDSRYNILGHWLGPGVEDDGEPMPRPLFSTLDDAAITGAIYQNYISRRLHRQLSSPEHENGWNHKDTPLTDILHTNAHQALIWLSDVDENRFAPHVREALQEAKKKVSKLMVVCRPLG